MYYRISNITPIDQLSRKDSNILSQAIANAHSSGFTSSLRLGAVLKRGSRRCFLRE